MSLHIKSDGEEALLAGDVAHHPCQMAHLNWSSTADTDPAQSAATRRELFGRFADTPVLVIAAISTPATSGGMAMPLNLSPISLEMTADG